ncbi:ATP-binding protein [Arenimonas sp. MALMAid1274]|uniref:ATP-binding protein n=1 Tax=Arenimonas sp. MALMAid1274 TaxID=3411630 RepID=UPI003BA1A5A7
MTLRGKLLLLSLSILALPWAGWKFVQQLEVLLRQGQEQALLASAEALARGIAVRPGNLPAAGPGWYVHQLDFAPRLDGEAGDWPGLGVSRYGFGGDTPWLQVALGRASDRLHLLVDVADTSAQRGDAHWPADLEFDRLRLRLAGPSGELLLRLANSESGELRVAGEDGLPPPIRVEGFWREHAGGYTAELALPQDFVVRSLGLEARDLDANGVRRLAGSLGTVPDALESWPLHGYAGALEPALLALAPPGMRALLVDREAWVIARAGHVRSDPTEGDLLPWRRGIYRALLFRDSLPAATEAPDARRVDRPEVASAIAGTPQVSWRRDPSGARLLLTAAVPVKVEGQVRAALSLERSNSEVLLLTDRAFSGLLGVSLVAFLASGGVMFLFASRLGARIRRLRDAAERALDREGRVTPFPVTRARDEVGDLSRSFASLLDQVAAYTDYLRSLSGKLSHELNTPLAIVRTSLDNLDSSALPDEARTYIGRARDGVERMGNLVRTMSEVTRIEHAIQAAEPESCDLRALVADCAEGYRSLLAPRALRVELPPGPLVLRGAPELVVQALDKLVDNARGFCPEQGWVRLTLAAEGEGARLAVANQGPPVPEAMRARLFDSLVSLREKSQRAEGATHLGFGLYVVKLVAELHHGHAEARNLPAGDGVEFTLHLHPLP